MCSWAELMRRAFEFDVLACPRCGRAMRLIALIEQAEVIRRMLRHLGQPTEVPPPAPARAPPALDLVGGGPEYLAGRPIAAGGMSPRADNARVIVYDREPTPDYDEPC